MINYVSRRSKPTKHQHGVEEKLLIAAAQYKFPEERRLIDGDHAGNVKKIRSIGNPYLGNEGVRALVASGGLCAPLTPLYDIPDFAVNDRPVRDSLPSFQAERGGISVPSVSTIGDITTAITVIEESADAGRWHLRHQVLSGPDLPDLDGRGGRDHLPLPRVREPECQGVAGRDRSRERAHDGRARADGRGSAARPHQGALDQRHGRRGHAQRLVACDQRDRSHHGIRAVSPAPRRERPVPGLAAGLDAGVPARSTRSRIRTTAGCRGSR